ncbi:MAG: hypothetical protein WDW36_004422 [Sanguina aurantia]
MGRKATLERLSGSTAEGLRKLEGSKNGRSNQSQPWELGYQVSERNTAWNSDLRLRLIKRFAADELDISEPELEDRLSQLAVLLPDLHSRLAAAPPQLVAKLAGSLPEVAKRLMTLKELFPTANVSTMVSNRLSLLYEDSMERVAAASVQLTVLLPGLHIDRLVQSHPLLLDVQSLEVALEDARRMMPGQDVVAMMGSNPGLILSLVKGKNLVPYDQLENP